MKFHILIQHCGGKYSVIIDRANGASIEVPVNGELEAWRLARYWKTLLNVESPILSLYATEAVNA